jgi:two-component system, chemotaxis family, CheB/CheR fusion protein
MFSDVIGLDRNKSTLAAWSSSADMPMSDSLARLFVLIRSEFGNHLSQYKQSTIDRRIERRMILHKLNRLDDAEDRPAGNRARAADRQGDRRGAR